MTGPSAEPTTTQKAAISEAIVGAQLMLASAGRLAPYSPLADDHGTDLLVADKVTGHIVRVQIKAGYAAEADAPGWVQFDVQLATFKASVDSFVLAVMIDPRNGALWRAWLIPATELRAISTVYEHKLAITPNPSVASRDRYARWRCEDMREVTNRVFHLNMA